MAEMIVAATLAPDGGGAAGGVVTVTFGPPLLPGVAQPETASSAETSARRIFIPTTGFLELDAPGAAPSGPWWGR